MPVEKICVICSNVFYVKPSHADKRFCCSKKCQNLNQKNKVNELNNNWKGDVKIKTCEYCGKEYRPHFTGRKYCSVECSRMSKINVSRNFSEKVLIAIRLGVKNREEKRQKKKYYCKCGNEIQKGQRKCKECKEKKVAHLYKICPNCHSEFKSRNHIITFCSKDCFKIYRQKTSLLGNNPNWKGGVKCKNQVGRNSAEHNEWITNVFKRDNYICQHCGQKGSKLNAHHILQWSKHKDKRFNISNGITLCVDCHRKEHKWKLKKAVQ